MTVIIKGMDMPKNCAECFALDESGDYPYCRITGETRGYNFPVSEKVMSKCPLGEVPTPHGRLIDADKMKDFMLDLSDALPQFKTEAYRQMAIEVAFGIGEDIDEQPTVIEAEE